MPDEPSPESIARAARLRAKIDKMTHPDAAPLDPAAEANTPPLSPREFIEQQMDKLDRKK
jgi:hypothetical protein